MSCGSIRLLVGQASCRDKIRDTVSERRPGMGRYTKFAVERIYLLVFWPLRCMAASVSTIGQHVMVEGGRRNCGADCDCASATHRAKNVEVIKFGPSKSKKFEK